MRTLPARGSVGISLVEVLVALVLFGVGGSLCVRVLADVGRSVRGVELGLHALFLLSELTRPPAPGDPEPAVRAVGAGRLLPEIDPGGIPLVRYEPSEPSAVEGGDPFHRHQTWRLDGP